MWLDASGSIRGAPRAGGPDAAPVLSVVIPTRDREATLRRVLRAVRELEPPPGGAEVIVVDNGSTDKTQAVLQAEHRLAGLPLRTAFEPRPGPAAARNRGIALARGGRVLFLGDDTRPAASDLLRHHVMPPGGEHARTGVLGKVVWDPEREVSQLMRWVDRGGPQFAYDRLMAGLVDPAARFYTAHVSAPVEVLREVGGFDDGYDTAAIEDMELGTRLGRAGMQLLYRPEALVLHDHPTTYAASLARLSRVGAAGRRHHELHPTVTQVGVGRPSRLKANALRALAGLLLWRRELAWLPAPLRNLRWEIAHRYAYVVGFERSAQT